AQAIHHFLQCTSGKRFEGRSRASIPGWTFFAEPMGTITLVGSGSGSTCSHCPTGSPRFGSPIRFSFPPTEGKQARCPVR
ncbi:MAG: hypothetical protein ACK523_20295, partial [Pirellulaceae bacterium]